MILTVTANPMVEQLMFAPGFVCGGAYRLDRKPRLVATGRPLNVARALRDLGVEVMALVALGGAAGRQIEELLEREHLPSRVVALRRESRQGVTIYDGDGQVSTFYGPSPALCNNEVEAVLAAVRCMLPARAIVVGGTVPREDLLARVGELGAPLVVDASGPALLNALKYAKVLLAKPNLGEARATFGVSTGRQALDALTEAGAQNAIVTDEDREAWFRIGRTTLRVIPPRIQVQHAVGSGDALCAGFLFAKGQPPQQVAAFATACGSYSASQDGVASLDRRGVEALLPQVRVEVVS
ncbi:MAG: hypothetical protein H6741_17070 [Alphaproteobacteria bacterium]|nr:hypothetical protein [Alphaproteobacteria bacterium]MCB9794428.1 hypothetical protein [Alphaproteobacteria bacterium]